MKKNKIFTIILVLAFLAAGLGFKTYLIGNKTTSLTEEFFDTDNLSEDIRTIHITDKEEYGAIIKGNEPVSKELIKSLESLEIKQSNIKAGFFSSDYYSISFYYKNASPTVDVNKSGHIIFENKEYEVKNEDAFNEFFSILEKAFDKNKEALVN